MDVAELERRLGELESALAEAGLAGFDPPADVSVLDEITAAIAPLRLPAPVRRFWELVDPLTVRVHRHPELTSPAFALQTWRSHVKDMHGSLPRVLFPIAYESWCHLFVELEGRTSGAGGAIFSFEYAGTNELRLVFADLGAYVSQLVSALRERRTVPFGDERVRVDGPSLVQHAPGIVIHRVFGPLDTIEASVTAWPEQWRQLEDITDERLLPLGASHSIGEVLQATHSATIEARIHGAVCELAGSGDGAAVTVTDGLHRIRIWCPAGISPFGPCLNGSFEFSVTAPAQRDPPSPNYSALADDPRLGALVDMSAITARLEHANRPVDAVATDIRPLD